MMSKRLRRMFDRLRAASNGTFRKRTSVRGGVQEPQRIHTVAPAGAVS
jgi:hypothetical protein